MIDFPKKKKRMGVGCSSIYNLSDVIDNWILYIIFNIPVVFPLHVKLPPPSPGNVANNTSRDDARQQWFTSIYL